MNLDATRTTSSGYSARLSPSWASLATKTRVEGHKSWQRASNGDWRTTSCQSHRPEFTDTAQGVSPRYSSSVGATRCFYPFEERPHLGTSHITPATPMAITGSSFIPTGRLLLHRGSALAEVATGLATREVKPWLQAPGSSGILKGTRRNGKTRRHNRVAKKVAFDEANITSLDSNRTFNDQTLGVSLANLNLSSPSRRVTTPVEWGGDSEWFNAQFNLPSTRPVDSRPQYGYSLSPDPPDDTLQEVSPRLNYIHEFTTTDAKLQPQSSLSCPCGPSSYVSKTRPMYLESESVHTAPSPSVAACQQKPETPRRNMSNQSMQPPSREGAVVATSPPPPSVPHHGPPPLSGEDITGATSVIEKVQSPQREEGVDLQRRGPGGASAPRRAVPAVSEAITSPFSFQSISAGERPMRGTVVRVNPEHAASRSRGVVIPPPPTPVVESSGGSQAEGNSPATAPHPAPRMSTPTTAITWGGSLAAASTAPVLSSETHNHLQKTALQQSRALSSNGVPRLNFWNSRHDVIDVGGAKAVARRASLSSDSVAMSSWALRKQAGTPPRPGSARGRSQTYLSDPVPRMGHSHRIFRSGSTPPQASPWLFAPHKTMVDSAQGNNGTVEPYHRTSSSTSKLDSESETLPQTVIPTPTPRSPH